MIHVLFDKHTDNRYNAIMPLDALHIQFAAHELNTMLAGGRIDKISAVSADTVLFCIRANHAAQYLIVSANPSVPRCYLSAQKPQSESESPPRFLQNFKRKLLNGRIKYIESIKGDRTIEIKIESKNDLGDLCLFTLVAELMGKHSNIVLVDANGKIAECVRLVGADMSSKRRILPGLPFSSAPAQGKADPLCQAAVSKVLEDFQGGNLHRHLLSSLAGLAPVSITEILYRAFGDTSPVSLSPAQSEQLEAEILSFTEPSSFAPCVSETDFYFTPYRSQGGSIQKAESLNAAMDAFYSARQATGAMTEKAARLQAVIKSALSRVEKKSGILNEQYRSAQDVELDRIKGELLTANLYRITEGSVKITVENYYTDPVCEMCIDLEPTLSPAQNAQRYYKRYQKKKRTAEMLAPQIDALTQEAEYLESVSAAVSSCETVTDLDEIAEELTAQGILKSEKKQQRTMRETEKDRLSGVKRTEADGYLILTGKNNTQNDALFKLSAPNDVWLHAKNIHGAHTVIVNPKKTLPPEPVLRRAASLTALYSKANASENVPIDYTFIKFVSKPKGAAPGKVVYTNQKTLYVTPEK